MGLMMSADQSFVALSQVVGSVAASLMTVVGVALLTRSRLHAYRWFKRSVLVTIFFVQVFLFFENQLAALGGLVVNLIMLAGLNAMIGAEHIRADRAATGQRDSSTPATMNPTSTEALAATRGIDG